MWNSLGKARRHVRAVFVILVASCFLLPTARASYLLQEDNKSSITGEPILAFQGNLKRISESSVYSMLTGNRSTPGLMGELMNSRMMRGVVTLDSDAANFLQPMPPFRWCLEYEIADEAAAENIQEWLRKRYSEIEMEGHKVFDAQREMPGGDWQEFYALVDNKLYWWTGDLSPLKNGLPRPSKECERLLKQSDTKSEFVVVGDLSSAQKLLASGEELVDSLGQKDAQELLKSARGAEGFTATLKVDDETDILLELDCADKASAGEMESAAKRLIALGLEAMKRDPSADEASVEAVSGIKTKVNNATLLVSMKIKRAVMDRVSKASERTALMNTYKQAGLSVHNFEAAFGKLPFQAQADQHPSLSWRVRVLPFLGHEELYSQFDLTQPWDSEKNLALAEKMPEFLGKNGQTNMRWIKSDIEKITDIANGTSNTICFIHGTESVPWTQNNDLTTFEALAMFTALKPNETMIVTMYDGSVRAISRSLDVAEFEKMLIPRNDEQ